MLSYPSGLHPRGLGHLFLRGPWFNSQSAQLSRKIPCDMAVTSAPQAMPTQHLWDPRQRVHISRWNYKREGAHVGSVHIILGYFLTIFSSICRYCDFLCSYTISFDCSPSCCGFDPVLLLLHCGYLEVWFISTKHLYLENLSYMKKQQMQEEAQQNSMIKTINSGSLF